MKGWVYVISNRAMPGLVKVGYSAKDPELRAAELNNTGSPHPYVVEYEVLIAEPYQVEQGTHKYLHKVREGKEWFRCDAEEAIAAIRRAANGAAIGENFKRADREKAESIRREREAEEQRQKAAAERLRAIEAQIQEQEAAIHKKYEQYLIEKYPGTSFWEYWFWCTFSILCLLVFLMEWYARSFGKESDTDGYFSASVFFGAIAALFVKGYFEDKKKESPEYRSILEKRDTEIETIRPRQSEIN
jgi:hypothetical protein